MPFKIASAKLIRSKAHHERLTQTVELIELLCMMLKTYFVECSGLPHSFLDAYPWEHTDEEGKRVRDEDEDEEHSSHISEVLDGDIRRRIIELVSAMSVSSKLDHRSYTSPAVAVAKALAKMKSQSRPRCPTPHPGKRSKPFCGGGASAGVLGGARLPRTSRPIKPHSSEEMLRMTEKLSAGPLIAKRPTTPTPDDHASDGSVGMSKDLVASLETESPSTPGHSLKNVDENGEMMDYDPSEESGQDYRKRLPPRVLRKGFRITSFKKEPLKHRLESSSAMEKVSDDTTAGVKRAKVIRIDATAVGSDVEQEGSFKSSSIPSLKKIFAAQRGVSKTASKTKDMPEL